MWLLFLLTALTKQSFEELVELAEKGDRRNVDLLVKDTAGSDYNHAPSDSMVSSFGKAAKMLSQKRDKGGCPVVLGILMSFVVEQIATSVKQT